MHKHTPVHLGLVVAAAAILPAAIVAQKGPSAPDLLTIEATYLTGYAEKLGAVAADEEFTQIDMGSGRMGTPRRVNSSVVWLGLSGGSIDGFRDVVAIDRAPLRTKDDRLMALFQTPTSSSRDAAHQLTENAVTQYLDPNLHALDQAMLALDFARAANQDRSTFKVEGTKTLKGAQVVSLRFVEKKGQPLIPTPQKSAAAGRLWVDPADGTVHQTELTLNGDSFSQKVTVTYAANAETSLWLPIEMYLQSEVSGPGAVDSSGRGAAGYGGRQAFEGRVTYTNFRRVAVDLGKLR
jgi:hypothetical protein